jgi:hypothetical protein
MLMRRKDKLSSPKNSKAIPDGMAFFVFSPLSRFFPAKAC